MDFLPTADYTHAEPLQLTFPYDVWLHILSLLHPMDVVRLRQTCTTLNAASRQRCVWAPVLHRVVTQNSMFIPPAIVDRLSTEELEKAATAPSRSMRAIHADATQIRELQPTRQIHCHVLPQRDEFRWVHNIPGGHYLLIETSSVSLGIKLLRVGGPSPELVAEIGPQSDAPHEHAHFPRMLCYCFADNGRVLRVAAARPRLNHHDHPSEITVYDIEPEAPSPAFMPIARTRNLGGIIYPRSSQGGLCDTRLVVTSGSSMMLWDFERDTRVVWPYQEEDEWPHLHIFGERVAISTVRAFQDARISIFVPPPAEGILTRCRLTPIYDLTVGSDVAICHPMHLAADMSFTFHLLRKGPTGSLSTYVLHKDEVEPVMVAQRPIEMHARVAQGIHWPHSRLTSFCDGGHVMDMLELERFVHSILPASEDGGDFLGTVRLASQWSVSGDRRAFDPTSGRVYELHTDCSLSIVDYL